jgi:hypothetical protein
LSINQPSNSGADLQSFPKTAETTAWLICARIEEDPNTNREMLISHMAVDSGPPISPTQDIEWNIP